MSLFLISFIIIIIIIVSLNGTNYFIDDDFKMAKLPHPFPIGNDICSADGQSTNHGLLSFFGENKYLQYTCINNSIVKQKYEDEYCTQKYGNSIIYNKPGNISELYDYKCNSTNDYVTVMLYTYAFETVNQSYACNITKEHPLMGQLSFATNVCAKLYNHLSTKVICNQNNATFIVYNNTICNDTQIKSIAYVTNECSIYETSKETIPHWVPWVGGLHITVHIFATLIKCVNNSIQITPTYSPTIITSSPTLYPTMEPTIPTLIPTFYPTMEPTLIPTLEPTQTPTINPTYNPSTTPTSEPTLNPTYNPTNSPTIYPTKNPTGYTLDPTREPTREPTSTPTNIPSNNPSLYPTYSPTITPTIFPSKYPTLTPSIHPTMEPTSEPTNEPTSSPLNSKKFSHSLINKFNKLISFLSILIVIIILIITVIYIKFRHKINKNLINNLNVTNIIPKHKYNLVSSSGDDTTNNIIDDETKNILSHA